MTTGTPPPRIDPALRLLIPPLSEHEFAQLEANIRQDGCREPLVVWEGTLLDGHNRLAICEAHRIPYRTTEIDLPDRDSAVLWIEENQLGRRNLNDDQRAAIAESVRERRSALAKRASAERAAEARWHPDVCVSDTLSDAHPPGTRRDTRAEVAQERNIPERKLREIAEIRKKRPEAVDAIRRGEKSIAEVRRELRREEVRAGLEDLSAREAKAIEGIYDVIVIDPPWPMKKIELDRYPTQVEFDYPTMAEDELAELYVPCADDCHVWLWTTQHFLTMAFRLLEVWNLRYVCTFVWHKPAGFQPLGLPQFNCEFVLYARRGSPVFVDTRAFRTCFEAPRGRHSEKPEVFYEMVRRVTAGRRLDMFNRRQIEGFEGWGNEV